MTTQDISDEQEVRTAARDGDEAGFTAVVKRYRRELHLHCYRMTSSLEEAEDLVQETFLRAWSKRSGFEGRSSFRAWLYRIATNASLDALDRKTRRGERAPVSEGQFEVPWLQPYPDRLLEAIPSPEQGPGERLVAGETVELAFLVAIQQLSHRERAALLLRSVVGFSAKETAEQLDISVAAVNSALQRARAALRRHLPKRRADWAGVEKATPEERQLLRRFVEAQDRCDLDAFVELMTEDARFAMLPEPDAHHIGAREIVESWKQGGLGTPEYSDWRSLVTAANRQPAVACYLRKPGWDEYRAFAVDVLRIEGGQVAEIIAFPLERHVAAFDLPPTLPPSAE